MSYTEHAKNYLLRKHRNYIVNKYARKSLRTRSESTAIERGKAAYLEIKLTCCKANQTFLSQQKKG